MDIILCNTHQDCGGINGDPSHSPWCVDDFGVKITGWEHGEHIINALKEQYEVTVDWNDSIFCRTRLKWDYPNKRVDLSMPEYMQRARTKYTHKAPKRPQHSPHKHIAIKYSATTQW
eukprot:10022632-Ditylum_brightwellii.AAC.1